MCGSESQNGNACKTTAEREYPLHTAHLTLTTFNKALIVTNEPPATQQTLQTFQPYSNDSCSAEHPKTGFGVERQ